MEARKFERLKLRVARELTAEQCLELEGLVREVASARLADVSLARRTQVVQERRRCPHCNHEDVVKHGLDAQRRQRFRCRRSETAGCGKTFNALTGTAFARMRKPEKWAEFARLMSSGFRSLDEVRDSGIGIARLTAWRWRMRLLQAQAARQAEQVTGVIEADETFFRTSYKGHRGWRIGHPPENRPPRYRGEPAQRAGINDEQVPVLTALDRTGGVIETVLRRRTEIVGALEGRIAAGSVVCSDGLRQYVDAAVAAGSEHRRIRAPDRSPARRAMGGRPRRPDRMGLGNVNAHHERVKTFVNREARGVSTRNLHLYLGWLRAIRRPGFDAQALIQDALSTAM